MASSALILAQANPSLLNAFPGWKAPVHIKAQATMTGGGAVTMTAAQTTPGVVIARAIAGTYTLSFPPCRHIGGLHGHLSPASPTTPADVRDVRFLPASDAAAAAGTVAFSLTNTTNVITDPTAAATIDVDFWADLG